MTYETFVTFCGCRDPMKVVVPAPFALEKLKRAIHDELPEDINAWHFFDEVAEIELKDTMAPGKDPTGAMRVHCHPCDEVNAVVHFESKQVSLKFLPAVPLKVVLEKALDELELEVEKSAKYLLSLVGDPSSVPLHTPLGTLTSTKGCTVDLDLVMEPKING